MSDLSPYQEPKLNKQLWRTGNWIKTKTAITGIAAFLITCLFIGMLIGSLIIKTELSPRPAPGPFSVEMYQCDSTGVIYREPGDGCLDRGYIVIAPGERGKNKELVGFELLKHNVAALLPYWLWAASLAITFIAFGWVLRLIVGWREVHSKTRYAKLRAKAQTAARKQLYVVAITQANRKTVYADCYALGAGAEYRNLRFPRNQVRWAKGSSEQSVGWFTGAYYDNDGVFHPGDQLLVMSPTNDHKLLEDETPEVEAITKATEIFRKL